MLVAEIRNEPILTFAIKYPIYKYIVDDLWFEITCATLWFYFAERGKNL